MQKPLSTTEQAFFKALGERIATLRKERGLTQAELAETLGCSQPQVFAFEKGRRRLPVSSLPPLAHALRVSVEELLGMPGKAAKRGPASQLEQQLERLTKLPKSQQRFVSRMIETVLEQAG